ncbi:hypothetical protein EDD76_1081 [Kineothrix alysoides]|uniref:Uncharacterized protein n=1 Tax=Kineothrix alysoides TaxID=1469948 RepID=A0A4R1QV72_9FIRM|nr:DUF6483 family protein [Kineothrix alysoides]TCL57467.1 hypothetical protein EDD76_1081 [Kineothrix alysoides]
MFENDYIMRLLYDVIRTLKKLIFKTNEENGEVTETDAQAAEDFKRLSSLIDEGKINEAENLLTEEMEAENPKAFQIALLFYEYLNSKDNDFLEDNDFSRREISDGLKYAAGLYGYSSMIDALLANAGDD